MIIQNRWTCKQDTFRLFFLSIAEEVHFSGSQFEDDEVHLRAGQGRICRSWKDIVIYLTGLSELNLANCHGIRIPHGELLAGFLSVLTHRFSTHKLLIFQCFK